MATNERKGQAESAVVPSPFAGRFGGGPRRGPVVKPKNFSQTLRKLWQYVGKERKWLTILFAVILVDSLITLSGPYLIGVAVDAIGTVKGSVHFQALEMAILALAIAYVTDGTLTFMQGWMMAGISQRIVLDLRRTLFAKLQKLPLAFFDARPHGEMMSRLSNDIDNVSTSLSQSTTQLMAGAIAIIGSSVMMLVLSPLLFLATLLITVPLVFLLARTITKRTSILFKEQQAQLGRLNGHIEETISGIQIVQAFNREKETIAEFDTINAGLYGIGVRAQIWSGFLMPLLGVINNLCFAVVAILGGILAVKGQITVGVIASFLTYSRQFVRPLNDIASTYNVLQSGVAGAERVFEVLEEQEEPVDSPTAVELKNPQGHVVFKDVSFGYRADEPILKHVSFTAPTGSSIALVGPTGAGKTTIVNLLTRFYDVTSGSISIDGRELTEYTRDSLRRCFGIVLQDTYLFSGTIKENIKYGSPSASDEEVRRAARLANANAFIQRLPQGYETMLTENGGNLSQGQRQLLAISRAILADPSILILDEATSSIDTRTELHIQGALLKLMQGRTSFIIAHRLSTIRTADQILVVDHGEIVERGNHAELMAQKGRYYEMVESQLRGVEE